MVELDSQVNVTASARDDSDGTVQDAHNITEKSESDTLKTERV